MQPGQEPGAVGHHQTTGLQPLAHPRLVQQQGQRAGVDLAGLATTGPAVQTGGMRVVGAGAAIASQQHQARVVGAQAHRAQRRGGSLYAGVKLGVSRHEKSRAQLLALRRREARLLHGNRAGLATEAALQQLTGKQQAAGLHEGEARTRTAAKRLPLLAPLQLLAPLLGQRLAQARYVTGVGEAQARRQQAWQLRTLHVAAQRPVGHEHREEAGKAQRLHFGSAGFQGAAVDLRAHIDAEHGLHGGFRSCHVGAGGVMQAVAQRLLVATLQRGLPQPVDPLCAPGLVNARCRAVPGRGQPAGHVQFGMAFVQQPLPGHPHGQQVDDLLVVVLRQPCLPTLVGAPR